MIDQNEFLNYQAPEQILAERIIVVTGAGSGIGRVAALTFARYGATVVLLGRTLSKLEAVYDEIELASYPKPAIFPINLEGAAPQDYLQLQQALQSEFGRVDGLLHNAAELGARTSIGSYPVADWHKVLQVNVTAQYLLSNAMLPLLKNSPDARVLFTGSSVGVKGKAYWGAYAVSKAASDNLMEVLADELEETPIRVNAINPGATRTDMRATAYPAEDPNTVTAPEAIMNRYLYLMGPASSHCNGQRLDAQPK